MCFGYPEFMEFITALQVTSVGSLLNEKKRKEIQKGTASYA